MPKNRKEMAKSTRKASQNREVARREKQRAEAAKAKARPKSVAELVAGIVADYANLEGAVAQLEIFADRRAKYVNAIKEKEPTKYSELRAEAYTEYLEKIKPLREAMKDLAEFIGKAEDAPTSFEKMQFVSGNLNKIYHATVLFEERSHELEELDRRFQQEFIKKHKSAILDTPDGSMVVPMNEAEQAEALADEPMPTVEDAVAETAAPEQTAPVAPAEEPQSAEKDLSEAIKEA